MADHHSPTVIQPDVPLSDMSPLEHLLLSAMFDSDTENGHVYFYAELSIDARPNLELGKVRAAVAESGAFESRVLAPVLKWLDERIDEADGAEAELDIEARLENTAYLIVLQDIVRRSTTISYFLIEGAYTCTRMRPDGFGGWAGLVHAGDIRVQSTQDLLEAFINEAKLPG